MTKAKGVNGITERLYKGFDGKRRKGEWFMKNSAFIAFIFITLLHTFIA